MPPDAGLSKEAFITFASAFQVMFPFPSKSSIGSVDVLLFFTTDKSSQ